jgi:alpha-methylacyl-CoA racemase
MNLLSGIKVLDLTYYLPGPYAAMRLAEMGADVIKVEPPEGDPAKSSSKGIVYRSNNRGKEFVTIDLKTTEGKAEFVELINIADVLLESFRPDVMKRLGFDYEAVKEIKPDIVYCSMTGYGRNSPLSAFGSHDLNYMALSGILSQFTDAEGNPAHPKNTIADYIGAVAVSEGILAALVHKFRTGKGAYVDIAIADELLKFQGTHLAYLDEGLSESGIPEIDGNRICYGIYSTKDGRHVVLGALEPKFWDNFCTFANRPDWKDNAYLRTGTTEHVEVCKFFKSLTWDEWLDISCKTDFCVTPVMNITELSKHPHWQAKGISMNKMKTI